MGMVSNKIEVMILTQNGKMVYWDCWLDNEIQTVPTHDKSLFSKFSSVNDFVECIGKGFKDEFWEDDWNDDNFIKEYSESFADEFTGNPYRKLKSIVKKAAEGLTIISAFKKVVLLSNNDDEDNERTYQYDVFDLENNTLKFGNVKAKKGDNHYYDPDDCTPKSKEAMESLLN